MDTPVLFLVFKRPDTTRIVFERLRSIRPTRLFVAADGPRAGHGDDQEKCRAVREIVGEVDWPCKLKTLMRDDNLGCGLAPSSAISWFFQHVEEGIILEDDCLPDPTFFPYCAELLARYRNDGRIGVIGGNNFLGGLRQGGYSYYFSRYGHIWGWATWKRYWDLFDFKIKTWPEVRDGLRLYSVFDHNPNLLNYWSAELDSVYKGRQDVWDYQLSYAGWSNNILGIVPEVNLVTNIGFGPDATHTNEAPLPHRCVPSQSITFPLRHPPYVIRSAACDAYIDQRVFGIKTECFSPVGVSQQLLSHDAPPAAEVVSASKASQMLNTAVKHLQKGNLQAAESLVEQAAQAGGLIRDLHLIHALVLLQRGQGERARMLLQKELNDFPDNQTAASLLADLPIK